MEFLDAGHKARAQCLSLKEDGVLNRRREKFDAYTAR